MRTVLLRLHRRDAERGQILILAGGGMIVFLLIVGIVIDLGFGFRERRDAQNVADLASMAGTKVVADDYLDGGRTGTDVYTAVAASADANGCDSASGCTWTAQYVMPDASTPDPSDELPLGSVVVGGAIPLGTQGVQVVNDRTPETFFMKVIGITNIDVAATATALTSQFIEGAPAGVLLPIGTFDSDYQPGTIYELTEGDEGPGNFGWLTWLGSPSAPTLAHSLCYPDNPAMTFPVWIEGAPGNMNASAVRACLDGWIASGSTVLIPIWGQTNDRGGANLEYEIIGLAAFVLTGYDTHASKIEGRFVEFYALPSVPAGYGAPPCNVTDPACTARTNFIGLTR